MARYRKLPVEIDAVVWDASDTSFDAIEALGAEAQDRTISCVGETLYIDTLDGVMRASPGDWIIKGVKGELYPIKGDIFADTYEPL